MKRPLLLKALLTSALFWIASACEIQGTTAVRLNYSELESWATSQGHKSLAALPKIKDQKLDLEMTEFWESLVKDKIQYGTYLEDRHFKEVMYCHEQCVCIAAHAVQHLKKMGYRVHTLRVFNTAKSPMVGIYSDDKHQSLRHYFFHNLVVIERDGSYAIFDPIAFIPKGGPKNQMIFSVANWLDRVETPEALSYNLFLENDQRSALSENR